MNTWFRVENKASNVPEVFIFDDIGGWGVTAMDFIIGVKSVLTDNTSALNVHINSYGGEVFAALAMYNYLRRLSSEGVTIDVHIDGVAASAASVIAMAGDRVNMPANAFLMVHDPLIGVMGNSRELRRTADTLDAIRDSLVGIYANKTGRSTDEIVALLADETWLNAEQAFALGMVDNIVGAVEIAANAKMQSRYPNGPEILLALAMHSDPVVVDEPIEEQTTDGDEVDVMVAALAEKFFSEEDIEYLDSLVADDRNARISEWDEKISDEDVIVTTTPSGEKAPTEVSKKGEVSNLFWAFRPFRKGK